MWWCPLKCSESHLNRWKRRRFKVRPAVEKNRSSHFLNIFGSIQHIVMYASSGVAEFSDVNNAAAAARRGLNIGWPPGVSRRSRSLVSLSFNCRKITLWNEALCLDFSTSSPCAAAELCYTLCHPSQGELNNMDVGPKITNNLNTKAYHVIKRGHP